jgi:hypothetical protein
MVQPGVYCGWAFCFRGPQRHHERAGVMMGKSMSGPDWEDIRIYMGEISKHNKCTVTLIWDCDGFGDVPRWRIHAMASPNSPDNPAFTVGVGVYAHYPHRDFKSLEGCVFTLLARCDAEIGRAQFQRVLDIT